MVVGKPRGVLDLGRCRPEYASLLCRSLVRKATKCRNPFALDSGSYEAIESKRFLDVALMDKRRH